MSLKADIQPANEYKSKIAFSLWYLFFGHLRQNTQLNYAADDIQVTSKPKTVFVQAYMNININQSEGGYYLIHTAH